MNDLNEMLVKGAIDGVKDIAKELLKSAAQFGRREFKKLLIDFQIGFGSFLDRNYKRISRIKTLLNPSSPVSLEATYVAPNLDIDGVSISEKNLLPLLIRGQFMVITGIGGSGKSVFLKHLFIRFYQENLERVPFFLELRSIRPETTLIEFMPSQLSAVSTTAIDEEVFRYALKAGKFIFLLDGFDEIEPSTRESLAKQILDLSYEYSANTIVLTSRPDGPFGSWNEFSIARMEPFSKKQVLSLISKMRCDKTVKKEFSRLVREELYDTHENYLSNPLLATLMLLTFDQGAEIPNKMHIFFERAFDVLFYKHDATKQTSFRRKFKTSLSIDEFRSVFATFSAFSYLDHGSSFTHAQAINCATSALQYNESSESADSFLSDLCVSVSILIREGDNYNYIHRSLQEFFVAQFVAHRELEDWDALVERLLKDRPNDTVVSQIADINRDRFERQFLSPRITSLREDLEAIDVERNPAQIFLLFFISASFTETDIFSWTVGRGSFYPKWHYMTRLIEETPEFKPQFRRFQQSTNFNWKSHFTNNGVAAKSGEADSVEIEVVSDAAFLGTPMIDYLRALKLATIAIGDRLRVNTDRQKQLLSTALLRKPLPRRLEIDSTS